MSSDKVEPQVDIKRFLDAAALITLFTSAMYLLGWQYWVHFFSYFGIGEEFINLTFEQTISTTWFIGFSFIVVILILIGFDIFEDYSLSFKNIFFILVSLCGLFSMYLISNYTSAVEVYKIFLVLFFIFALVIILVITCKYRNFWVKRIAISGFLKRRSKAISILIVVFLLLLYSYGKIGEHDAEIRAHDQNGTKIILETSGGWQSPKDAVLITHMNNKYFIYNFSSGNSTHEVYIIEDSQVTKVTLQKK